MKRVLTFLALMLLPLSVMAMTPVSDSTLSDVTGQSGVNIHADLTMDINIGTLAWGDRDGAGTMAGGNPSWATAGNNGGYVGVNNLNIQNLHIRARTETGDAGTTSFPYSSATTSGADILKPITIDVITGTGTASGSIGGDHGANVTFVRFGLGSLQITMGALSLEVALGARGVDDSHVALSQILGTANIGTLNVYIHPRSYVDIYTQAGVGVNLDMYVVLDKIDLAYVSWGDTDHAVYAPSGSTVDMWFGDADNRANGYVGLANLNFGEVIIDGTVRIDVATARSVNTGDGLYGAHPASIVHISLLDGFNIKVNGPITFDVRTAAAYDLPVTWYPSAGVWRANELGNVYMSGLEIGFKGNSWIDIWAH